MIELLDYAFFRNALLGLCILSVIAGVLGCYIVSRRLVSISGGITHACFGGLGLGYYLGMPPIGMASIFAAASAIGVHVMARGGRVREDSAIAVVWAAGMAIGVTFVFLTPGAVPELNSFLFGNVLTITPSSIWAAGIFALLLLGFVATRFKQITACAFDPDFARVIGLRAELYNGAMLLLIAVGIVLMIRCVGMMLLMSMLTLPAMVAELFTANLKQMMPLAVGVSLVGSLVGLFLGAWVNVPASALIVATQIALYLIARLFNLIRH